MKFYQTIYLHAGLAVLAVFLCVSVVFAGSQSPGGGQGIVRFSDYNNGRYIDRIQYYEDTSRTMTIGDVVAREFRTCKQNVQNMGVSPSVFWFKFRLHNDSELEDIVFIVDNSLLGSVTLYEENEGTVPRGFTATEVSKYESYNLRTHKNTVPEFHVNQPRGSTATYYVRVESFTQLLLPIKVQTRTNARYSESNTNLFHGLYFGVMLVVFFYNLFVFLSVKDRSYLYYIFYVLSVALVQLNVTGIGFKYLWPDSPEFERSAVFLFPSLTAFASILFVNNFLNIKTYAPQARIFFALFILGYLVTLVIAYVDKYIGYELINANATPLALFMFGVAAFIYKKYKYRPAAFFLIAWTTFLVSIIIFVLKDYGVLPYNNLTVNSILLGSGLEVVLLSFALADKINILEAQSRANREKALFVTQENARIISEQNTVLEQKVQERTSELQQTNQNLEKALRELKDTQSQLVESEKMASLGQLTAGIAHEINNPINFVTSNVTPLKRDIKIMEDLLASVEDLISQPMTVEEKLAKVKELKQTYDYDYLETEIDFLLQGIAEGASRTAEIVRGLRLFSRLDEDDVKRVDLEEGLDSTMVIVNHLLNGRIEVVRDYGQIPAVECFSGKLNQVFLNIMSNGIQAIQEKWGDKPGGRLTVRTSADGDNVYIGIADNGSGMSAETKRKLFEPFFTTKDVGVGTGLGLSIVWNTIRKHNGNIQVNSTIGEGTEFVLTIPIRHEITQND